ncbi:winged helix-turn-helix domain-containing protein [Halovivax limisalsi]|uniref:winged helix-turn-helix domain-containing protein n=1 Tax=Halovivax limisalsi TaxID=1453760 RepID=UPI001FFD6ECB|nr:winged helix-turn-helix domain-containing protein [Halovivax limisalsi]
MPSSSNDHAAKLTRLRDVAMTVRGPKNAREISEAADLSPNTARKYLDQLVEAGVLETIDAGRETRYAPDRKRQYLDQLRELIETYAKDDLANELDAIRGDVDDFRRTYDVETPDELRASVGADGVDAPDREQRIRDAEDWAYFEQRATMLQEAITLYDSLDAAGRDRPGVSV